MKEKAFLQQENWHLQEWLAKIDDKITEIEDLEDKVILVEDTMDNNNQETTESPIYDFTFYHSVFTNEASTPSNYPLESDKLLASFESIV